MSAIHDTTPAGELRTSRGHVRLPMFLAVLAVGLVGIVASIPFVIELVRSLAPDAAPLPDSALITLVVLELALLVALSAWSFATVGRRVGLDAPVLRAVLDRQPILPVVRPMMVAVGLIAALGLPAVALDLTVFRSVVDQIDAPDLAAASRISLVVYGGVFEEVLVRAGLMSLLGWLLWRLAGRGPVPPPAWVRWTAIVGAAVAFGVLHLPAAAAMTDLTALMVGRTIVLNASLGIGFGWLAWRHGLEAAIGAHLGAHVFVSGIPLLVL